MASTPEQRSARSASKPARCRNGRTPASTTTPHWADIAQRWRRGVESRAVLAEAAGVTAQTLARRARREGWGAYRSEPPLDDAVERRDVVEPLEAAQPARLKAARALYATLSEQLVETIRTLKRADRTDAIDEETTKTTMRCADLVKAHAKALFAVLECEDKLDQLDAKNRSVRARTTGAAAGGAGPSVLDLAAARAELHRRLARLLATETGRGTD